MLRPEADTPSCFLRWSRSHCIRFSRPNDQFYPQKNNFFSGRYFEREDAKIPTTPWHLFNLIPDGTSRNFPEGRGGGRALKVRYTRLGTRRQLQKLRSWQVAPASCLWRVVFLSNNFFLTPQNRFWFSVGHRKFHELAWSIQPSSCPRTHLTALFSPRILIESAPPLLRPGNENSEYLSFPFSLFESTCC